MLTKQVRWRCLIPEVLLPACVKDDWYRYIITPRSSQAYIHLIMCTCNALWNFTQLSNIYEFYVATDRVYYKCVKCQWQCFTCCVFSHFLQNPDFSKKKSCVLKIGMQAVKNRKRSDVITSTIGMVVAYWLIVFYGNWQVMLGQF